MTLEEIYKKYDYLYFACGMDYCLEKGMDFVKQLTDEEIEAMHQDHFEDDFLHRIAYCGREIARSNSSMHQLVQFCAENVWKKPKEEVFYFNRGEDEDSGFVIAEDIGDAIEKLSKVYEDTEERLENYEEGEDEDIMTITAVMDNMYRCGDVFIDC